MLELTRWPVDAGHDDGYYGVDRKYLANLVTYWRTDYDWGPPHSGRPA